MADQPGEKLRPDCAPVFYELRRLGQAFLNVSAACKEKPELILYDRPPKPPLLAGSAAFCHDPARSD